MINPEILPGLLVAVPILAATLPLVASLSTRHVGWPIAAGALAIEAGLTAWLAAALYADGSAGRIVHLLGGPELARPDGTAGDYAYAVGIELVADPLSMPIVCLVAVISLLVLGYARRAGPRGNGFYTGYLLLTGGLMGVVLTGDLFNLFVFLEITGLATYALVATGDRPAAAVAALKYLMIGTVGASVYLIGVGYLYLRTGTLNMVDLSIILAGEATWGGDSWVATAGALYTDPLVIASFAFVAAGLGVKAAIFPLHVWQPDAYQQAPDTVTIYISALVSTAAAYALGRILLVVFSPAFFAETPLAANVLLVLTASSVVLGSLLAAAQQQVKRLFAYSSVAHFGLIMTAFAVAVHPAAGPTATRFAIYGAVVHLLAHGLIKAGLFAAAGTLGAGVGARTVESYAGLARARPVTAGAIAVLGFGLVGVPPIIGFLGKWYIALGAIAAGLWPVVAVVLASTLLSLLYVARLLEALYFDGPSELTPEQDHPSATGSPDSTVAADGGMQLRPGIGMIGLAAGLAVVAFVGGLLGAELTTAIDPVVEAVLDGSPEVGTND